MIDWLPMINWLLIVAALTILCVGFLARRRLAQIEAVKARRRRFFKAAEVLASDDRTPDELLRLVHGMAELIPSRTVLWRVVWFAVTGEMARAVQQPPTQWSRDRWGEIAALPDELQGQALEACVSFAQAISHNNVCLGPIVRRTVLFAMDQGDDPRDHESQRSARAVVTTVVDRHLPSGARAVAG